jgi:hypothetical protein
MVRKSILAAFAIVLVGVLQPAGASARGRLGIGFYGSGGSFHGGFGTGLAYGAIGVGLGLANRYYGGSDDYGDGYPYGYGEYAEYGPWAYNVRYRERYVSCYPARQRFWTPYGWRLRVVQVCD